jgi:hypothetical protein
MSWRTVHKEKRPYFHTVVKHAVIKRETQAADWAMFPSSL